jgi:hypothetical protein
LPPVFIEGNRRSVYKPFENPENTRFEQFKWQSDNKKRENLRTVKVIFRQVKLCRQLKSSGARFSISSGVSNRRDSLKKSKMLALPKRKALDCKDGILRSLAASCAFNRHIYH